MPSYDYRCDACKNEFTVEKSMSDETKPSCESCGGDSVNRVWNVFIMSGGRTTDYGQGTATTSGETKKKSGCGSCSSHACGTCH